MERLPLTGKVLPAVELGLPLKGLRLDGGVQVIEGVHQPLNIRLVHFLRTIQCFDHTAGKIQ